MVVQAVFGLQVHGRDILAMITWTQIRYRYFGTVYLGLSSQENGILIIPWLGCPSLGCPHPVRTSARTGRVMMVGIIPKGSIDWGKSQYDLCQIHIFSLLGHYLDFISSKYFNSYILWQIEVTKLQKFPYEVNIWISLFQTKLHHFWRRTRFGVWMWWLRGARESAEDTFWIIEERFSMDEEKKNSHALTRFTPYY